MKLAKTEREIEKLLVDLESDFEFLTAGVEVASGVYTKEIQVGRSLDQKMMELSRSVVEFEKLVEKCRNLQVELSSFADSTGNANTRSLTVLKSGLFIYLKELFSKKRTAASHVLVFMIADELRNKKPYAIIVRFMPYKSLTDLRLSKLEMDLEEAMRSEGMTVVGG